MEIKRDIYLNKLINKKHNGLIKVVTLYPYLKEQIKDDGIYYVLLDEVQLLDN